MKKRILLSVFFPFCFLAQNNSSLNLIDTNFFFISNTYHCSCEYDPNREFDVNIRRKIEVINAVQYIKFEFEHSNYGLLETLYVRKEGGKYYLLNKNLDTTTESLLFGFNEKIDQQNDVKYAKIFGHFKTRFESDLMNMPFAYKMEAYDTEFRHISLIYFDPKLNVSNFQYYQGYVFNCLGISFEK